MHASSQAGSSWVLAAAVAVVGIWGSGGQALAQGVQAAPIPPDAAVTKDKVHGLKAEYFNFGKVRPPGVAGIDSRDIANDFAGSHTPDATWMLKGPSLDCPPGPAGVLFANGKTVGEFLLGSPGTNGPLAVKMSSRNVYVFTGFIDVPKAGTFTFRIPADDGAELSIGGVTVHQHFKGGWYGPLDGGYDGKAEFIEPGIYPVKVLFWDREREAGIEVYSDVNPKGEAREVGGARELTLLPFLSADN